MTNYQQLAQNLQLLCPNLSLKEGEKLANYTTFAIGGPCPLMAFPSTQEEILACFQEAKKLEIPVIPLGNGSNLLAPDGISPGFYLHTGKFCQILAHSGQEITVQSGILLSKLANFAQQNALSGLEFAQGIPGSLGGGILMNAGAYGGELKDVVTSVTSLCPRTLTLTTRPAEELHFSYRHSLFADNGEMILSATLSLTPGDPQEIQKTMKDLAEKRRDKQPLNLPSCGSTFKRPPGHVAAALIDQCGLKGYTIGGAQVSPKHAGFVVNIGGATCSQVLALVAHIQATVVAETGVGLELEVKLLPPL